MVMPTYQLIGGELGSVQSIGAASLLKVSVMKINYLRLAERR